MFEKDWADLDAISLVTPGDIEDAATTIADLVGESDPAAEKLKALTS